MGQRLISQRIYEMEESYKWAHVLRLSLERLVGEGKADELSYKIATEVNRIHWLPAVLLALTCCRYSDVKKIKLNIVKRGDRQFICEGKTGAFKVLRNLDLNEDIELKDLDDNAKIIYTNYGSLKEAIMRSTPRKVRQVLKNQHDGTHIFRHLRASFMAYKGYELYEIQDFLNHRNPETTKHYIHKDLFSFF